MAIMIDKNELKTLKLVQEARSLGASVNIDILDKGYQVMVSVKNSPVGFFEYDQSLKLTKQKVIVKKYHPLELSNYVVKKRLEVQK